MTRPTAPTARQTELMVCLRDYRHRHGISPTMIELGAMLGISKEAVFEHVANLERRGFLTRTKHAARSITIAESVELPPRQPLRFPVLGSVSAGRVRLYGGSK